MSFLHRSGAPTLPALLAVALVLVVLLTLRGGDGHAVLFLHQQLRKQQALVQELEIRVAAATNETLRVLVQKEELLAQVGRLTEEIRNLDNMRQLEQEILDIQCATTREKLVQDWEARLHSQDAALRSRDERSAELDRLLAEREVAAQHSADSAHQAQHDRAALLGESRRGLLLDSLVMGQYLKSKGAELEHAWQGALAGQQQRGVLVVAASGGGIAPGQPGGLLTGETDSPSGGGGGSDSVRGLAEAFMTLHVLRHHLNCSLPAALMYWGGTEAPGSMSSTALAFLQEKLPGVALIDASTLPYPQHHRALLAPGQEGAAFRYKLKAFAIYAAPFREVLYMEAGSLPLLDPSPLFSSEQYLQHRSLFWPDLWGGRGGGADVQDLYSTLQIGDSPWAAEAGGSGPRQAAAGQLLLDRERHWQVLEWALWLNSHSEVVHRLVQGDKDTFRAAFHLAGAAASYQQVELNPAFLVAGGDIQGSVHLHPNGAMLLSHRRYGLDTPLAPSTHVTASASTGQATALLEPGVLAELQYVAPAQCSYSLLDWPAAQQSCSTGPNASNEGPTQALLAFEIPPASHLARAEVLAAAAFALFRPVAAQADA